MANSTITRDRSDALAANRMQEEDFCKRFVDHMIRHAGFEKFDDGTLVREYAEETAPTYWEDQHQKDGESPEDCADADMSYWGED